MCSRRWQVQFNLTWIFKNAVEFPEDAGHNGFTGTYATISPK